MLPILLRRQFSNFLKLHDVSWQPKVFSDQIFLSYGKNMGVQQGKKIPKGGTP
ncbi:MAG: hypothetical protein A4E49_00079 [Methanosaeta sp. PtaU1.Bin112]|nr:MAG: hypothetical protein A4E49_00079 [Methanosaeta sp. PtaU1.Bin112]